MNIMIVGLGLILDASIVVLIVLFTIIGYFKGFFKSLISLGGFFIAALISFLLRNPVADVLDKSFGLVNAIGQNVGLFLTKAIAIVGIFLIVRVFLFLFSRIFGKLIKKGKIIGKIDKVLGLFFGLARGVIIVVAVFAVISFVKIIPTAKEPVTNFTSSSLVSKYLYEPIEDFIYSKLNIPQ